jgi:hypothetical protein
VQLLSPAVVVHGVLAIIIILLIIAVVVLGVISLVRFTTRGAKKAAKTVSGHSDRDT